MAISCCTCGKEGGLISLTVIQKIDGKNYCQQCALKFVKAATEQIVITTTNNVDGFKVKKYIDIESVEIVIGTGVFSEISGGIADFFGTRSGAFEQKLQKGKQTALDILKYRAFEKGGNAVIAIDLDYTEFSGNRIGLIANGTIVEIVPVTSNDSIFNVTPNLNAGSSLNFV